MDIDTFFDWIRQNLIDLMNRELTDLGSARVQTTASIRSIQALEDDFGNIIGSDRVDIAFSSRMTEIYQGSDLNEIIDEMLAYMRTQIENPALTNSRFVFDEVLFLDVNFHQLDLTRDSSYINLPDWIANKKAVINPKNENAKNVLNGPLLQHYIIRRLSNIPNACQISLGTLIITTGLD